jgi:amino acid permease
LAAAETKDPKKEIPKATRQVVWRICLFYVINLFLIGLIVPENSVLYNSAGAESRHSPFVIAIELAGIKALPSIFNAVILISVMSVANSCTFASTRTFQALAQHGKTSLPVLRQYFVSHTCEQVWVQRSLPILTNRAVLLASSYFNFFSDVWLSSIWIKMVVVMFSIGFWRCLAFLHFLFSVALL